MEINNIRIDSRLVDNNSLFIAIIGDKRDGHLYLQDAYNNGCRNFIVSKNHYFFNNINLSLVSDTKKSLLSIAKYYIESFKPYTVGITGSVGKTTTRNMVSEVLSKCGNTIKNDANQNNEIGVPLTIFRLKHDTKYLALEMGMDHKGDLLKLTDIVNPNIGIITNIGMSHIGNFKDKFDLFLSKLQITDKFNDNNILIVNGDDKYLSSLRYRDLDYKLITIGFRKDNDLYCTSYKISDGKTYFKVNDIETLFVINTTSKYLIYNALFAIEVGLINNISIEDIKDALTSFKNEKKRLEKIVTNKYTIINDCYNSSLDSIRCAVDYLKAFENRKVLILGDIKELGVYEKDVIETIPSIINKCCDLVIYIGDNIKYAVSLSNDLNYIYFENKEDFYKRADTLLCKDDVILIKASNSCNFDEITKYLIGNN